MNKLLIFLISAMLASCSNSPFKENQKYQKHITDHLSQGAKYVNGNFDEKFSKSGQNGIYLTAIGKAVYPLSRNQGVVEEAAISAARFKIVESGPTEFKIIVQKAIGNSLGNIGEFSKIETSITEVKSLTGIKVSYNDIQCKIKTEPTENGGYNNTRECRAIAKVKMIDLVKAYDFTLERKYRKQINKKKIKSIITSKKVQNN